MTDFLTVAIHTLGCKVSQYESAAIKEELLRRGYNVTADIDNCDVCIINTCTVTAEADRKCASTIRRAASHGAKVIVCGCYSQVHGDDIEREGVVYYVGTADKMSCVDAVDAVRDSLAITQGPICNPDEYGFENMRITDFDRTRAYIKVEDGCDSKCAYCIIPRARGPVRSKHLSDVLEEARYLVENGCKEIVITGIEVDAWGKDLNEGNLTDLLEAVDGIDGDFRIRIGSLDPFFINEDFARRAAKMKKLAPHFHVSVQSASSAVLAKMRRRYNGEKLENAIALLKKYVNGVAFTCDVIVGFPGESEEDFLRTCDFARSVGFINMHIFPYSERPDTVAASLPNKVSKPERKNRATRLARIRDEVRDLAVSRLCPIGSTCRVLVETELSDGRFTAHGADFVEFIVSGNGVKKGEFAIVRVFGCENGVCYGVILPEK
ncbi:MAG: tRNA (N(6)-L-threonylcarbamoyladenosine(37)-C(2))-methylthiotransferase MtaB [Clostridia bacterium]|nr:tRNA (N(6)-L-threonylcarbamoyladenosine(37)-C(2))-methylthiotransferase MtaB [Clostridia bacterium]